MRLHLTLVLLSFAAGAADAFAFLALNGTFTANMTGNLVLAALFSRPNFGTTLVCALVAIVAFAAVLYGAFRMSRTVPSTIEGHRRLSRLLLVPSVVAQVVVALLWITVAGLGKGPLVATCAVIAASAGALALQTVAAKKASDIDGVTTTYVTGTLTSTMQALAERNGRGQGVRVLSILALPAGALAGTALYQAAPAAGPLLALGVTAVATVLGL
ncbi:MAG: DUF1275 family protein, partial [Herbiconiux sp.]|nr:DUF1275 family protein [Herbiconiux sp.]